MRKYLALLCSLLIFSLAAGEEINTVKTTEKQVPTENINTEYTGKRLNNERNIVKEIEVRNNREVPTELIKSMLTTKVGDTFSAEVLFRDYTRIKKEEYIDNIAINPQSQDGGVRLVVTVEESRDAAKLLRAKNIAPNSERKYSGAAYPVAVVAIDGLRNVKQKELLDLLSIKAGGNLTEGKLMEDQRTLIETGKFQRIGYQILETGRGAKVVFHVVENPILKGINIIGNTKYTTEELKKVMGTRIGEVFSVNAIREDRERILKKYYDDGYILADIVDIDITNDLVLEFTISEGVAREVGFKKMVTKNRGQRRSPTNDVLKTRDFVIEREIDITANEVFNIKDFDSTSSNLIRTGAFKNVKYEANQIPGDPDGKSILLLLEEERTASLQGAVSYGSEVGLLGMVALRDENWDGRNQNLGVQYEKSDDGFSNFSLNFYDPWIEGTDRLSWGWSAYKSNSRDSDSFLFHEMERYGLKLNAGKGLSRTVRIGVGTRSEYVVEDNANGKETDAYLQNSLFSFVTYDTRNNPMNATRGEFGKFQVEGGYAGGNDADFFGNVTVEGRKYHRGFTKNNTMAYRIVGGIMTDSTKESQTFWVGGNSLRGYDGGTFKGREKLVATVENRTQVNDILGIVFFYDVGRAWNQNPKDIYKNDRDFAEQIAMTAGVGARLNTPLGPLRFDFGWPVGEKIADHSGMKFYFQMGQSF